MSSADVRVRTKLATLCHSGSSKHDPYMNVYLRIIVSLIMMAGFLMVSNVQFKYSISVIAVNSSS